MKQIDVNELTPIQSKVLMAIRENPLFTIKELAFIVNLILQESEKLLKNLKKKEKLYVKGQKRWLLGGKITKRVIKAC